MQEARVRLFQNQDSAETEGFEPCGNDAFGEVSPQSFPVDFPSGYKKIVPRRHKARGVLAK